MRNVLVFGGSGGIGRALTWQILDDHPDVLVTATYFKHKPNFTHTRLRWRPFDVRIEENYIDLANRFEEIDGILNCVGFLHEPEHMPEKSIRQFSPDFFYKNLSINTLPTILIAKHFGATLKHSRNTIFATISAKVGSIEDNRLGGWVSYRASKAALNMALKTLAIEWRRSHKNVCVAALHPGTTATGLSEPFQNNVPLNKLFPPEQSANYLWQLIKALKPEDSGRFWSWDGAELPW